MTLLSVLLTATLTAAGISPSVALCLVIGANLGSGLLAMLNNSAANAAARRLAGQCTVKLVGSLIILPFAAFAGRDDRKLIAKSGTGDLFPRLLQPCTLAGHAAIC